MEIARTVLELDCAFQPQARRLINGTRKHNHKQLLSSTYLYTRGVLLADKADKGYFNAMVLSNLYVVIF